MIIKEIETRLNKDRLPILKETEAAYKIDGRKTYNSPADFYHLATILELQDAAEEKFYCIALNTKNRIEAIFRCGQGTINTCMVDIRGLFQKALLFNTANIVIFHNHPSGDCTPSEEDKKVTDRIYNGASILGLSLLDHIIIGDKNYYSFFEHNVLTR